jgi:uncharacterized metal-binding protein YceD (DUF177 family)
LNTTASPLEHFTDLGRLSEAGEEIVLAPSGEVLARLAAWADLVSVEKFTAKIELTRKSTGNFHYDATIEADLTQSCVVTLEPVKAHVAHHFTRELHLSRMTRHPQIGSEMLAAGAGDDEVPEELESPHYDVAGPVLEEFSLALDPYPRAPGAAFESPGAPDAEADNPFAVLKRLKTGG